MSKSKIQWTERTWNPVRGCSMVSAGCTNCYAMRQAHRLSGEGQPYEGLTRMTERGPVWTGTVWAAWDQVDAPRHWRKPSRVFVNSMSDLFHEGIWQSTFIDKVFETMRACPQHTFQVLTKRPMLAYRYLRTKPVVPNVWLGVSVEDQKAANDRIPLLLDTPAAIRFLSIEPLLDRVYLPMVWLNRLDWVIVGGESGPHARTCDVAWIRDIVAQCRGASVPCFVKQLGRFAKLGDYLFETEHDKGGDPLEWPEDLRVREYPK